MPTTRTAYDDYPELYCIDLWLIADIIEVSYRWRVVNMALLSLQYRPISPQAMAPSHYPLPQIRPTHRFPHLVMPRRLLSL